MCSSLCKVDYQSWTSILQSITFQQGDVQDRRVHCTFHPSNSSIIVYWSDWATSIIVYCSVSIQLVVHVENHELKGRASWARAQNCGSVYQLWRSVEMLATRKANSGWLQMGAPRPVIEPNGVFMRSALEHRSRRIQWWDPIKPGEKLRERSRVRERQCLSCRIELDFQWHVIILDVYFELTHLVCFKSTNFKSVVC